MTSSLVDTAQTAEMVAPETRDRSTIGDRVKRFLAFGNISALYVFALIFAVFAPLAVARYRSSATRT